MLIQRFLSPGFFVVVFNIRSFDLVTQDFFSLKASSNTLSEELDGIYYRTKGTITGNNVDIGAGE